MRLRPTYLALAMLLAPGAAHSQSQTRTFDVQRKEQGFALPDRYPTVDFQVELRLALQAPGSILDTVGIDAAPRGSWSLAATPDGNLAFNLWDGRRWSRLLSSRQIKFGQPALVTLRRVGDQVTLRLDTAWSRTSLPTPLSGRPVYVGDYLPDAHWGSKYNIHQGAVGRVELIYFGAPKLPPAVVSDFSPRVVDEQGVLTPEERRALAAGLRDLKAQRGVDAAVAFLPAPDRDQGNQALADLAHRLLADGRLPEAYAIFGYGRAGLRLYFRSNEADQLLPTATATTTWQQETKAGTPPQVLIRTLAVLAGKPPPSQPSPPSPPPSQPAPAAKPAGKDTPVVAGTAGKTRAEIGQSGGTVASGSVTVAIPAGALLKPDAIVVQPSTRNPFGVTGVSVEFEHGRQTLLKPATIAFPLPAGADPAKLVALRSLSDRAWVTMPLTVDAARGQVVARTNHFCDAVVLDLGRTTVKILGGVSATVGGTLVLAAVGAAPATSGLSLLVAVPFFVAGWAAGGATYNAAQAQGLVGSYPCPGFSIFWDPRTTPAEPYLNALVDRRTGYLINFTRDSREPTGATIGPATGAPSQTITYVRGEQEITASINDVQDLRIPVSVLGVASELNRARLFYNSLGVETPPNTTVYVYDRVGRSNDQEKATNSGLWDGVVLGINSKSLSAEPPNSADSRAASAHEYWHAVVSHNRFSEMWPGTEEATALSMESLVWASPPNTHPDRLMQDFLGLHAWHECSPVLRSGLFTLGPDEVADTRGYKQWPLLKFIYHVYGKATLGELLRGRLNRARLDEIVKAFALAAFTEDQVVPDPATLADHPQEPGGLSVTGFKGHVLVQDPAGRSLRFGENLKPKATSCSINAYAVELPARADRAPPSPLVVRRRRPDLPHYPVSETVFVGRPVATPVAQPRRDDVRLGERFVVVPESWDLPPGHLPVMFVGGTSPAGAGALGPSVVDAASDPNNPILVYRLAPPTGVTAEHLPAMSDADAKSRFKWTRPQIGGTLAPAATIAAYRLYGRKVGRTPELVAELALKLPDPPSGWYQAPESAARIDPDATSADIPLARARAIGYDEFALSSVDGLMKQDGRPLESPAGWTQGQDILAALAKCNFVSFGANLAFEGTFTTKTDNNPPQTVTHTYPMTSVNPPNIWGFSTSWLKGGRLTINGGNFEFVFSRSLKFTGTATSAGSMDDAISGYIPLWPLSDASRLDGVTTVTLKGQVAPDGRLLRASMTMSHPNFGCSITFGDFAPGLLKIEGDKIQIYYFPRHPEATAKSSGHSAWSVIPFRNGSTEFKMTKYLRTDSISLNFSKSP